MNIWPFSTIRRLKNLLAFNVQLVTALTETLADTRQLNRRLVSTLEAVIERLDAEVAKNIVPFVPFPPIDLGALDQHIAEKMSAHV